MLLLVSVYYMATMFRASLFIVVFLGLSAVDLSYADDSGCVGWDDKIEDLLFEPLKDEVKKAASEFYSLPDMESTFGWGVSVKSQKGTVGNLTSFDIVHLPSAKGNASYMCQSADGSNMTLAIDLGLTDFELTLDDFAIRLPVFPNIGNTKTSIKNSGNAISISVSVITNSDCTASLNYIKLRELGETSVHFEHGLINSAYQFTLNHLSNVIIKIMMHYGIVDRLNESLQQQATKIIAQQGQKICDILNGGGL